MPFIGSMWKEKKRNPIGTINGVYLFQLDIDSSKRLIAEYRANEKRYSKLAKTAKPNQRGAYAKMAMQAKCDAERWERALREQKARVGKFGEVVPPSRGGDWLG